MCSARCAYLLHVVAGGAARQQRLQVEQHGAALADLLMASQQAHCSAAVPL